MEKIGAIFENSDNLQKNTYPFFERAVEDLASYPNLNLLNPLPFLKDEDRKGQELYYENDPHFNVQEQKALAMFLSKELL